MDNAPPIIVQMPRPNEFVEISPGMTIVDEHGVRHSWQITQLWTDAQLKVIHIFRVEQQFPPEGHRIVSSHFEYHDGKVIQVLVTEEIPPPEPPVQPPVIPHPPVIPVMHVIMPDTSPLPLAGDPIDGMDATTKRYVDRQIELLTERLNEQLGVVPLQEKSPWHKPQKPESQE